MKELSSLFFVTAIRFAKRGCKTLHYTMKLPGEQSHVFDFERIKKEAFMLLNLGYGFLSIKNDNRDDVACREAAHIFQSFGELYCREVSFLLTSICISCRMLDDQIKTTRSGIPASSWNYDDMLGDDLEGNSLTLRDCFNKTIHAARIDHEWMQLPEVYLSGTLKGAEWSVRIALLPFCTSVFEWVEENRIATHKAMYTTPVPVSTCDVDCGIEQ